MELAPVPKPLLECSLLRTRAWPPDFSHAVAGWRAIFHRFLWKNQPGAFFRGSFDLAVTRFSGRKALPRLTGWQFLLWSPL
jgi:hypothetical protein